MRRASSAAISFRALIPRRVRPLGQGVIVAAMVGLNVVIFVQYIFPFFLQAQTFFRDLPPPS